MEEFAEDICGILKDAVKAVGIRGNRAKGRLAPWWTKECKAACLAYRAAVVDDERITSAKAYRATVASAKREYWKIQVESMKSSFEIFKLVRWAHPRQAMIPPPILHEGNFVSDQAERAKTLRDCLLSRHSATDDLDPCLLPGKNEIPWTDEIAETEVRPCTIGSGNTCPGSDGISVELLTVCWESISTSVTKLFRACLRLGHYPSCFKLAEVLFLSKTGLDPSSVKIWRPIALLCCLGKGLERLISKRMSHLAIVFNVVGKQQFGALPKRSATDLVSCVVHDTEEARTQGWASTFVTMDVQGAFVRFYTTGYSGVCRNKVGQTLSFAGRLLFLKIEAYKSDIQAG